MQIFLVLFLMLSSLLPFLILDFSFDLNYNNTSCHILNKTEMMKGSKSPQLKPRHLAIKEKCIIQSNQFKKWDSQKNWKNFHSSHYDWWAFPIDNPSRSYRDAYQVQQKQKQALIKDKDFIQALKSNAILVCRSWGWDLQKGKRIKNADNDQKWQRWSIRLSKMCRSLQIFEQDALFKNAILYANILLKDFKKFTYAGENLTPYFEKKYEELFISPHKQQKKTKKSEISSQKKESKKIDIKEESQKSSPRKETLKQNSEQGSKNTSPKIQSQTISSIKQSGIGKKSQMIPSSSKQSEIGKKN